MRTKTMMKFFGITFVIVVMAASSAQAACDPFPKVPWWGSLSHETVDAYVSRKHEGKWAPYIKKWSKQVDRLKDVHKRESSVFVRYKGKKVKIAGDALANYIKLVAKRVNVTRCLAGDKADPNLFKVSGK